MPHFRANGACRIIYIIDYSASVVDASRFNISLI